MSYIRLPSIQHIAKVIRSTATETERELHKIDGRIPPVSYRSTWSIAYPLYSGSISLKAALDACGRLTPSLNAQCNAEVVKIIWDDSQGAEYFCRPLKDRLFPIRKDLAIPVRPKFYLVKNGVAHIYWLQPWKTFDLTVEQLGVLASVLKMTFVIDDFENAELYLLDTSADGDDGVRNSKVMCFADLPLLSEQELKDALSRFASAYDAFVANRKPKPERERHRPEDYQGDLFQD